MDAYLKKAIEDNNNKAIIINQPFGAGDILFCEPIARKYHNNGYVVIWPVEDNNWWFNEYLSFVHFRKRSEWPMNYEECNDDYQYCGIPVIPLRFSNPLLRGLEPHDGSDRNHWMNDKYERLGIPVDTWKTLQWTRNEAKEDKLFKSLRITGDYAFVNDNFGGGFASAGMEIKTNLPIVRMRKIDGFTMLDWAKVIINASEIHTVETSVVYMIEALPVKAEKWHLYPRKPYDTTVDQVKNIISLNKWILHENE